MCSLKVRKYHRKIPVLESVFNKVADVRARNFITMKLQHRCFPVKFAKLLRIPILKNICERLLLYLHYNSHDHFHFHHFHYHLYHCKIHLYRLRIVLTIPLDCNIIPCLFQLNFVFFPPAYIFLQSYSELFVFYAQQKDSEFVCDHQKNFRCFLYTYIYKFFIVIQIIYSHYLHLIDYTYLRLLIYTYVLFILLYELDKIV